MGCPEQQRSCTHAGGAFCWPVWNGCVSCGMWLGLLLCPELCVVLEGHADSRMRLCRTWGEEVGSANLMRVGPRPRGRLCFQLPASGGLHVCCLDKCVWHEMGTFKWPPQTSSAHSCCCVLCLAMPADCARQHGSVCLACVRGPIGCGSVYTCEAMHLCCTLLLAPAPARELCLVVRLLLRPVTQELRSIMQYVA